MGNKRSLELFEYVNAEMIVLEPHDIIQKLLKKSSNIHWMNNLM
ncbi:hypothetical protein [uncultured Methanosphaera sp.]|nr:hypothetical protein [uncultured Methanosphaera sp.]